MFRWSRNAKDAGRVFCDRYKFKQKHLNPMKKTVFIFATALFAATSLTSCSINDWDEPKPDFGKGTKKNTSSVVAPVTNQEEPTLVEERRRRRNPRNDKPILVAERPQAEKEFFKEFEEKK